MAESEPIRVVIVGGGLAGLAAAEAIVDVTTTGNKTLARQIQIDVLEAKRTAGGRAGSFTDRQTGDVVDYCQHVAMGCCESFIGLLRRSGLDSHFQRFSELTFLHPDFPASRFRPSRFLPPPLHLAGSFGRLRYLSRRQKLEIATALWRLMRSRSDNLADCTAADWLTHNKQSPDTISAFWDVILVSALGESTDLVSMKAARKVVIDGFVTSRSASEVWVPNLPLSDLIGTRLVNHLQGRGVRMHWTKTAIQLQHTGDRITGVRCGDGGMFPADFVVCAIPWHAAAGLLMDSKLHDAVDHLDQIATMPASPITGIHLWFDRPISELPHAVMVGTTSQWFFSDPIRNDLTAGDLHYCQVVISASAAVRRIAKSDLVETVLAELRHAFPLAGRAKLVRSKIVTDPHSVFSIRPGVDRIRPPTQTRLGGLLLAGDWVQTGWPATMEGAVRSGRAAVDCIWADSIWADLPSA